MSRKEYKKVVSVPDNESKAKRRANQALAVAIVALLIGVAVFALALGFGISNRNDTTNTAGNVAVLQQQVMFAQNQLLQVLMNSTLPNMTVVQNGTFKWTLQNNDLPTLGTYRLKSVITSGLEFLVLVVDPPVDAVTIVTSPPVYEHSFSLGLFTPGIQQLDSFLPYSNGYTVFPLTYGNVIKVVGAISNCNRFASDCVWVGPGGEVGAQNALLLEFGDDNRSKLVGGLNGVNAEGLVFALSTPWELVLRAS
jgi:hypothetical protein